MASLYRTWEEASKKRALPPEWDNWEDCRAWVITNRYKMEYGYKGEFSPQGCLKAIPGYVEPTPAAITEEKGESDAGKQTKPRSRRRNSV